MELVICYISIIGLMNIPLVPCTHHKEDEFKAMVMDLIFLSAYEVCVEEHGMYTVDKSEKTQFLNTWDPVLGTNKVNAVFNKIQKHLKYALDIVECTKCDDISSLIITIHIRILALNRAVNYLACMIFAQFNSLVYFKLKHCENIAIHFLIFSQLGMEKLIKKFESVIDEEVLNYNFGLPYLSKIAGYLPEIPITAWLFTKSNSLEEQIEFKEELKSIDFHKNFGGFHYQAVEEISKYVPYISYLGILLLDMNFGAIPAGNFYGAYAVYNSHFYHFEVQLWTDTASGISEKLEQRCPSNSDQMKYYVTNVIRENIIYRAKAVEVNLREFVETYERVKPNQLRIFVNNRRLVTNVHLWD